MRLPDFIGVGAQRSGTTWLHGQLAAHPDIFMPQHRKELRFFGSSDYERGLDWYSHYFEHARPGQITGEITPTYIEQPEVAHRIQRSVPNCRLIFIVRNPVDRVYSAYRKGLRDRGETRPFEQYVAERPSCLEKALYGRQLEPFLRVLGRDRFLFIVFEQAIRDRSALYLRLAEHLGISAPGFDGTLEPSRNESFSIRFPGLYRNLRRCGLRLRERGFDRIVETTKQLGVARAFRQEPSEARQLPRATRERLWAVFEQDVALFEHLTGCDCAIWRR